MVRKKSHSQETKWSPEPESDMTTVRLLDKECEIIMITMLKALIGKLNIMQSQQVSEAEK